jgi:sugar diacid utilization regulator
VLHLAKDQVERVNHTSVMLAEHPLSHKRFDPSHFDAARVSLRELHGAMADTVQRGGGLAELAKLAHDASGVPIAIVVPGLGCAIEPAGMVSQPETELLERRVHEHLNHSGTTDPDGLWATVQVCQAGRPVGLVGRFDAGVDRALEHLVNARVSQPPVDGAEQFTAWVLDVSAAAVLTALMIEETRLATEHRLRGSFLEQLRDGERLSGVAIARRAARLGCDVSHGAVMLCAEVDGSRPRLVALGINNEHPGAFAQTIESADGEPAQVWVILPALRTDDAEAGEITLDAAKRLASRLRQHGPVGLSRFHADPTEFSRGMDEAELMLDVMRKAAVPSGGEMVEGTYKLLFRLLASHPDELSHYLASTVAPLVSHDEQYRTDLVRTLEVYLETNCNMNVTADTIFAHRHTVAHRLDRINELTGLDPTVHEDREQLGLGLKIHRLTA